MARRCESNRGNIGFVSRKPRAIRTRSKVAARDSRHDSSSRIMLVVEGKSRRDGPRRTFGSRSGNRARVPSRGILPAASANLAASASLKPREQRPFARGETFNELVYRAERFSHNSSNLRPLIPFSARVRSSRRIPTFHGVFTGLRERPWKKGAYDPESGPVVSRVRLTK